jgi:hypothetical protein
MVRIAEASINRCGNPDRISNLEGTQHQQPCPAS